MIFKPSRFRVQNYKSIQDSGVVWLSSDITVLAGRNESGKSSLLEALRDFHPNAKEPNDDARPLHADALSPRISVWFAVDSEDLNKLLAEAQVEVSQVAAAETIRSGIGICYDLDEGYQFCNDNLSTDAAIVDHSPPPDEAAIEAAVEDLVAKFPGIPAWDSIKHDEDEADDTEIADQEPHSEADNVQSANDSQSRIIVARSARWLEAAESHCDAVSDVAKKKLIRAAIKACFDRFPMRCKGNGSERLLDACKTKIPPFVFFSDDQNLLPFELSIASAASNRAVQDFAKISGLDLKRLQELQAGQKRRNYLSQCAASISGTFCNTYSQDRIELVADADGDKLRLSVKPHGEHSVYRAEQRSRGFQWFLSFFLRLNSTSDNNALIIIDEPGLYLHATAQRDVLTMLERLCKDNSCRVVFSTHSPYLIDTNRLDRIRLVERSDKEGTRVNNKIHRDAMEATLTPIMTAIGFDLGRSLSGVGKRNLLLEGISDYYLITGFRLLLNELPADVSLIPAVGATKIPQLASLLIGWDLEFIALVDNDREGHRCEEDLKALDIAPSRIVRVSKAKGSIESLFEDMELEQLVHGAVGASEPKPTDKVLLAKKFCEICATSPASVRLRESTRGRIMSLLTSLAAAFKLGENSADPPIAIVRGGVGASTPQRR